MANHWCILNSDFSAASDGSAAETPALGPGGLQSLLRAWGIHGNPQQGTNLYIQGTGTWAKLVHITVDVDKSGTWVIGDAIWNHNDGGGVDGDDWKAVLVFIDATNVWVQINIASTDIDSVDTADGVHNETRSDDIAGANMTAATAPGITCDTNSGADGSPVRAVGCAADWSIDGTHCTWDGNKAANCLSIDDKDHWYWELIEFENALGANVAAAGTTGHSLYHFFVRCKNHDATGDGFGRTAGGSKSWYSLVAQECQVYSNGTYGFYYQDVGPWIAGCVVKDNGDTGVYSGQNLFLSDNVIHDNGSGAGDYGVRADARGVICGNAIDGNHDSGLYVADGPVIIRNNRFTDNGDGAAGWGLEIDDATVLGRWNAYKNNNQGDVTGSTAYPDDEGSTTRMTPATEGYTDEGSDDFNCEAGVDGNPTEIDIDGTNKLQVTRGIPSSVPGAGGGGGGGMIIGE